jgi:hypothetical protein
MKTSFELSQIIEQFGGDFIKKHQPNAWTLRNLNALRLCRTAALGGHKDQCDSCGKVHISYNSCANRHCPKCQAARQAFWVEDVSQRVLDTKYFHVVFTVPEALNQICLLDSKYFYSLLFSSVWQTLRTFGYTHYGVESGAIAVLHTWGQNLSLHPHIHCLVPAAGVDLWGKIKSIGKNGKYLYPVKKLSVDFRSVFMKSLKNHLLKQGLLSDFQSIIDDSWAKPWVVYTEPSFADAERVIKYLGNYTHRVAISNSRIQHIDNENVHFFYKDYKDHSKRKLTSLSGVEFLRRFCMHILPKGFVKVRYYGVLSNRFAKITAMYRSVKHKVKETTPERIKRLMGFDVYKCPFCKVGIMHRIEELPRVRSPGFAQVIRSQASHNH